MVYCRVANTAKMGLLRVYSFLLQLIIYCVTATVSYKILVAGGGGVGSHYYIVERVAKALAQRDHDVTVYVSNMYTRHRQAPPLKFVMYESLVTMQEWEGVMSNATSNFLSGGDFFSQIQSQLKSGPLIFKLTRDQCHSALDTKLLNQLRKENFDIIIGELTTTSLLGQALDKPYVFITCPLPASWQYSMIYNPVNPSYIPAVLTGFDHQMTFTTRLMNTLQICLDHLFIMFNFLSNYDHLKEIHNIKPDVSSYKAFSQADLYFMNTDFTLDFARPLMPNTIPVGGILTGPAKPLDQELESFVQGSEDGIIIFSLGGYVSIVKQDMADTFARAFAGLSQRVIWKQRGKKPRVTPPNVKMMDWIPQNDLLGHPKTRLIVYQCGVNGAYEAIYHGVPVICLPVFYDQADVAQRLANKGAALRLDINTVTSEMLVESIKRVLNDDSFRSNMQTLSTIFKDKPNHPADEVALWTEYVVRHGGAGHLRSAAHDLNLFQYLLIDVTLFLTLCILIVIVVMVTCCKCLVVTVGRKLLSRKVKSE
ncbi:UDP-glucuronosyltransferase 2C1-like [Amphiura filiformis]|uniref:UDP-glucuronosyltransferase 2C1-like n=1 Tax=Amphiura filiformis TaxID=82378 RepID=UPI003B2148C4